MREMLMKYWRGEIEFNSELVNNLHFYLTSIAWKYQKFSKDFETDDFYSFGLTEVWKALSKFRLLCPECKKEFQTSEAFMDHCLDEHNKVLAPLSDIEKFVTMRVHWGLKRKIREERAVKRKPNTSISSIDNLEFPLEDARVSFSNEQMEVDIKELIDRALIKFNEIEKMIVIQLLDNFSYKEIAKNIKSYSKKKISSIFNLIRKTKEKFGENILSQLSQVA